MAFFNSQEHDDGDKDAAGCSDRRRLALMRSFEARLWELDVQVCDKSADDAAHLRADIHTW